MNFAQSFKLALKSLKTSKMRAFLTMLGIIIGVGAVIVILSLGNGMTNMMNSQFEKMGSNLIQVMTYGRVPAAPVTWMWRISMNWWTNIPSTSPA